MDNNNRAIHPLFLVVLGMAIAFALFFSTSHHRAANDIMVHHKVWGASAEKPCGQYTTCIGVTLETVNIDTGKEETKVYLFDAKAKGIMDQDVRNAMVSQMSDHHSNWNTSVIAAIWSDAK